jgi:hypothetical protein
MLPNIIYSASSLWQVFLLHLEPVSPPGEASGSSSDWGVPPEGRHAQRFGRPHHRENRGEPGTAKRCLCFRA